MKYLLVTVGVWNIFTFLVTGYDKLMAILKKRRVAEKHLILLALFLGALGVFLAMELFRHKTRHAKFKYGVPLLLALNLLALIFLKTYFKL